MHFIIIGLVLIKFIITSAEELTTDIGFAHRSLLRNEDRAYNLNLKVPDSPLMLFDRIQPRKDVYLRDYAKSRQEESSNETSTAVEGCLCDNGVCKCCTGYVMGLFNQKACMQVTYNPGDFAFDVAMTLNERVLYENTMSGKNPQPVCINPPRLTNLKLCGKFYNVFFPGRNFHFCLSMYGQWRKIELFNIDFDCLRMGAQGIAMVKPDDGGGLPIASPLGGVDAVVDAGQDDIEDYDENLVRSLFNIFDR